VWGLFPPQPLLGLSRYLGLKRKTLMKVIPEFQSIFTSGTAGQYFKHTLSFGMKDIIRFHGHSCEALYYTAAISRLICDKLFSNGVVDRTLLRGRGGESP
jgi:hypothetical protein